MPSHQHQQYKIDIVLWIMEHGREPGVTEQLEQLAPTLLILWHLDLEPARPALCACYAKSPRGSKPWDPIVMLRYMLLALLVGQPKINKWVPQTRANRLLPVLAGVAAEQRRPPGVGTYYGMLHRLNDGPIRGSCDHQERPSELERRRSKAPRTKEELPDKELDQEVARGVTEQLVERLEAAEHQDNPKDLQDRLGTILLTLGVKGSIERGLFTDAADLIAGGDGSALRTGASGQGRKVCDCEEHRCDCPRLFTDPDARWGYDSYRKCFFFGHHFYEVSTSTGGHDLPLALGLFPATETDYTASLKCLDWLTKACRTEHVPLSITTAIFDAGHDARPIYQYLLDRGATPLIPLSQAAPACHPTRRDLALSKRGVPICQANEEMAPWGSAGPGRKLFICPVKARWLDMCPLTDVNAPQWVCRPELKMGPTVSIAVSDNPRLFPPIPRNSERYRDLMKLRTGTERSNAVKKETFGLEAARHRRHSFWLIRLHLIALLQHAKAWVCDEEASDLVFELLGEPEQAAA